MDNQQQPLMQQQSQISTSASSCKSRFIKVGIIALVLIVLPMIVIMLIAKLFEVKDPSGAPQIKNEGAAFALVLAFVTLWIGWIIVPIAAIVVGVICFT